MKANKTYISLETAKLLKDCGDIPCNRQIYYSGYISEVGALVSELEEGVYPLFAWQEILWENAEKFFEKGTNGYDKPMINVHTEKIIWYLRNKLYEEADVYFRKTCVLIK
jgi:hypothetical protein